MAIIPVPTQPLPIVWQNTIIAIEPTSRYGPDGTPDTASINTTFALREAYSGALTFLAPGHHEAEASARVTGEAQGQKAELVQKGDPEFDELVGQLEDIQRQLQANAERAQAFLAKVKQVHQFRLVLSGNRRLVHFFTRLPVVREPDGTFKLSELVPREFLQLVTHGDFSVIALVPRAAQGYDTPPAYNVELVDWSKETETQVFGRDGQPALAHRLGVTWYWKQDPLLFVRYRYT